MSTTHPEPSLKAPALTGKATTQIRKAMDDAAHLQRLWLDFLLYQTADSWTLVEQATEKMTAHREEMLSRTTVSTA